MSKEITNKLKLLVLNCFVVVALVIVTFVFFNKAGDLLKNIYYKNAQIEQRLSELEAKVEILTMKFEQRR